MNERLEGIISRAYALALQVQDTSRISPPMVFEAEELSGECAELLALVHGDTGAFGDDDCIDPELVALAEELNRERGA